MKKRTLPIMSFGLVLTLTVISCGVGVPASPSAPKDGVGTIVAATVNALTPLATLQPQLVVQPSPMPSATSAPTVTGNSTPIPIKFLTGSTAGNVSGNINPGQVIVYSLSVLQGQPGGMNLGSVNNDVTMSIRGQDGSELLSPALKHSTWQGYFSKAQGYLISIYGGAAPSNFDLYITVSARITFTPGTDQIALKAKTVGGNVLSYVLYAKQGQTLGVTINTAPEVAALTIWGFSDGQPYARAVGGTTSFHMELPATQDYIIDVVPRGAAEVDFVLNVSVK